MWPKIKFFFFFLAVSIGFFISHQVYAQSVSTTPTFFCVGTSQQPPCATIAPTRNVSGSPSFSPGTSINPTGISQAPVTISPSPCSTQSQSVHAFAKQGKSRAVLPPGLIKRFIRFLLQLFLLIFQQLGITIPMPQPQPTPVPSSGPSGNPLPSANPCPSASPAVSTTPSNAPTSGVSPTVIMSPGVGNPTPTIFGVSPTPIKTTPAPTSTNCVPNAILVNPCRPWLGSRVKGYPQAASDDKSQILYEEAQIAGRQNDIAHTFHPVGDNQLSADDKYLATRPNGYLLTNWKPTNKWANISQSNATIDQMANSIKSIAPHKIFLALHHEPQNDVTNDPNCPNIGYVGSAGTPADYRNMWAYVHNRFAQDGVTNVVWVLIYQGYRKWNCLIPDMYPGNQYVDWVAVDDYGTTQNPDFITNTQQWYNLLTSDSDTTHNFLSKPWALTEWNFCGGTSSQGVNYYNGAKQALDSGNFPRIKAWVMFDALGTGVSQIPGCLLAYDSNGTFDSKRVSAYKVYANDPIFLKK